MKTEEVNFLIIPTKKRNINYGFSEPTFRRLEMISDIYYEATRVTAISDIVILNKLYMLRIFASLF
jgi:hypothetical protein